MEKTIYAPYLEMKDIKDLCSRNFRKGADKPCGDCPFSDPADKRGIGCMALQYVAYCVDGQVRIPKDWGYEDE